MSHHRLGCANALHTGARIHQDHCAIVSHTQPLEPAFLLWVMCALQLCCYCIRSTTTGIDFACSAETWGTPCLSYCTSRKLVLIMPSERCPLPLCSRPTHLTKTPHGKSIVVYMIYHKAWLLAMFWMLFRNPLAACFLTCLHLLYARLHLPPSSSCIPHLFCRYRRTSSKFSGRKIPVLGGFEHPGNF